jgi:hypothetical protein
MSESVSPVDQTPAPAPRAVVDATLTFFDATVHAALLSTGSAEPTADAVGDVPGPVDRLAPSGPDGRSVCELVVIARALIDPSAWQSTESVWGAVEWHVPGLPNGAWATYGERNPSDDDASAPPRRIPCTVLFRAEGDPSVRRARAAMARDGVASEEAACAMGWVEETDLRWPAHDAGEPFPGLPLPPTDATRTRDDPDSPAWRGSGPVLPLVLGLEGEQVTLNADGLDQLVLVVSRAELRQLAAAAAHDSRRMGTWSGLLSLRPGTWSGVVVQAEPLRWSAASRGGLARCRHEHELALLWRAARHAWQPDLPPVRHWENSPLHRALRGSLPGLARQSLREDWDEARRWDVLAEALALALELRLGLALLQRPDPSEDWLLATDRRRAANGPSEDAFLEKARALVEAGQDPTLDCWPLYTLGLGGLDPVSTHVLDRSLVDDVTELAKRYERLPGLWAPRLTQALVHGLLAAETGAFLGQKVDTWVVSAGGDGFGPDLTRVALKHRHEEFRAIPALARLWELQARQRRRAAWAAWGSWLRDTLTAGAIGAGFGAGVGGWASAVAGFLGAAWLGSAAHGRAQLALERLPGRRLPRAMWLACLEAAPDEAASDSAVRWIVLFRRMEEATALGAVWSPLAWRLVGRARREDLTARRRP